MVELRSVEASRSCGTVRSGSLSGVGYLIEPDLVVTAAQVIPHRARTGTSGVTVTFPSGTLAAVVEHADDRSDTALLRLERPVPDAQPLGFGQPTVGPCTFDAPQALGDEAAAGVLLEVDVADPDVLRGGAPEPSHPKGDSEGSSAPKTDSAFARRRMTLRAPALADLLLDPSSGLAGAPALVAGRVVGHLTGPIRDPNDIDASFAGLVQATPSDAVLTLLGAPPPGRKESSPRSAVPARPIEKGQYHAFVSYRAIEDRKGNDEDFAKALDDQLERWGFRCYLAPHVLFGSNPHRKTEENALESARVGLLLFSKHWQAEPKLKSSIAKLLKRCDRDPEFRPLLVRLDGTEVPELLTPFEQLDVSQQRLSLDKNRPADATALQRIALALNGQDVDTVAATDTTPTPSRDEVAATTYQQVTDEVMRELTRLRKWGKKERRPTARAIQALAIQWSDAGLGGSDVPVEAARLMNAAGEHQGALELLDRARAELDDAATDRDRHRIERMRGLSLSELRRSDEAIAALESVESEGPLDAWTGGALGSAYKRKWQRLGSNRRALLLRAYEVYRDTFARTLSYYPGINAATLAGVLGKKGEKKELAEWIKCDLQRKKERGESDPTFWDEASLGEAHLLLGEYKEALACYESAALQAIHDPGALVSMRRQFPLILGADPGEEAAQTLQRLQSLFNIGHVAVFAGGQCAGPGASPAELDREERLLRHELASALGRHDVSRGYCGAATIADLVFAESVLDRSGEVEIVLPNLRAVFRQTVVPERLWPRFDALMAHEQVTVREISDAADSEATRRAASEILDAAVSKAEFLEDTDQTVVLAYWDEANAEGPVRDAVLAARAQGLPVESISPRGEGEAKSQLPDEAESPASGEASSAVVEGHEERGTSIPGEARSPTPGPITYREKHLMVVGIDHYTGEWRALRNAANDARGVKRALADRYDVELVAELYDDDATYAGIRETFKNKLCDATLVHADDLVVFFFAGHGHTQRRADDLEAGYLVPFGASKRLTDLLPFSELRDWTKDIPARHVLFILDSCFSGLATGGSDAGPVRTGYARRVITAGAPQQLVADGGQFPGHSIFSGHLIDLLTKALDAPIVDLSLAAYLRSHVKEDTGGRQQPSLGVLPLHGGDSIELDPPEVD